jgi:hypothetical protein
LVRWFSQLLCFVLHFRQAQVQPPPLALRSLFALPRPYFPCTPNQFAPVLVTFGNQVTGPTAMPVTTGYLGFGLCLRGQVCFGLLAIGASRTEFICGTRATGEFPWVSTEGLTTDLVIPAWDSTAATGTATNIFTTRK